MSYDVYFSKNGETCKLNNPAPIGGTYCLGGNDAWLNITFNYYKVYSKYNFGIIQHDDTEDEVFLNGKTAAECEKIINNIIPKLKDDVSDDYWEATEGNAKRALQNLLIIIKQVPSDAICRVSA